MPHGNEQHVVICGFTYPKTLIKDTIIRQICKKKSGKP